MAKKTWIEKRDTAKAHQIKTTDKRFADIPEGSRMLIATPTIVDAYVKDIPEGYHTELATMRSDLAAAYHVDKTCPVTAGIFLRVVAEAAFEELQQGKSIEEITPFWRMVTPQSKLAQKLECGIPFIEERRAQEGIG